MPVCAYIYACVCIYVCVYKCMLIHAFREREREIEVGREKILLTQEIR